MDYLLEPKSTTSWVCLQITSRAPSWTTDASPVSQSCQDICRTLTRSARHTPADLEALRLVFLFTLPAMLILRPFSSRTGASADDDRMRLLSPPPPRLFVLLTAPAHVQITAFFLLRTFLVLSSAAQGQKVNIFAFY